jgi:hypothetical protein
MSNSGNENMHVGKFATPELPPSAGDEGHTMIIKRAAVATAEDVAGAEAISEEFGLPLAQMLGVISYCYSKGVFRSEDVAELLRQDPELKARFGRKLPDEAEIRRFRRRYSAEIEETLEGLYRSQPGNAKSDSVVIHKQATEQLHAAAWTDNVRR